jgi:hypothetical protein
VQIDLLTAFKSEGAFWRPGDNESVSGDLTYVPNESLTLTLHGPFGSQSGPHGGDALRLGVILGTLVNGTNLSLIDAFMKSRSFGAGASGSTIMFVNRALVGAHIPDITLARFRRMSFRCTSLEEWFAVSPIKSEWHHSPNAISLSAIFSHPDPLEVDLPAVGLKMKSGGVFNEHHEDIGTLSWSYERELMFESKEDVTVDRFLGIAWQCQNLMSLLIGKPVGLRRVSFPGTGEAAELNAVHHIGIQRLKAPEKHVHPALMILPLPKLSVRVGEVFQRWLVEGNAYKHSFDLYFGTLYSPPNALEYRFLSMTQALESFHRASGVGNYMERAAFKTALDKLLGAIPEEIVADHRVSLKNRLKYSNEFSLRKRITLLLASLPPDVASSLTSGAEGFVDRAVATRNYLTHFDDESKEGTYEGEKLHYAAERLRVFLLTLFLSHLGIDGSSIVEILRENEEVKWSLAQNL